MITAPRRSVTRFFIPLIDVLILLFCIFLLMPLFKPQAGAGAEPSPDGDRTGVPILLARDRARPAHSHDRPSSI